MAADFTVKHLGDIDFDALRYWDVVIIGAGPAGLAAGLTTAHRGLTTLIIETVGRGERVTLRDLGYFDSREWKGRTVKNKLLGDAFSIPSHRVPTFRPSSKLRKAVRR